jgi:glycosyltransferase involved in cell wall biosynthesis
MLAHALVETGHHVRVIGVSSADQTALDFESDGGVLVWRVKLRHSLVSWIRERYAVYRLVERWARSGLIDLVEVPDYEGMVAGWPALRIPLVARLHGSSSYFAVEMGKRPDPVLFRLERSSLRRADFRCSCSRYTAEKSKRVFGLRGPEMAVLYNPVTPSCSFHEHRSRSSQVVFSGTLAQKKGVVSLIRAWPLVLESYPHAELHMFGKDGRAENGSSMREYLISSLRAEIRHTIQFHGHVNSARLRSAFQSAAAAVFPSHSEAFALAPMEAMAEGCPTIYSRRASGRELIKDGINGLLIEPSDPREIAAAILRILNDRELACSLGSAGRRWVESRFSLSMLLPQNVDFYLECMRAFGSACPKAGTA